MLCVIKNKGKENIKMVKLLAKIAEKYAKATNTTCMLYKYLLVCSKFKFCFLELSVFLFCPQTFSVHCWLNSLIQNP